MTTLNQSDGSRGDRTSFDVVIWLKALLVTALSEFSDELAEFLIADRASFLRFLGLEPSENGPDHYTIWTFRQHLSTAKLHGVNAIDRLFKQFDSLIREQGYLAKNGRLIDARIVAAPK